jgi:hypothetical protein
VIDTAAIVGAKTTDVEDPCPAAMGRWSMQRADPSGRSDSGLLLEELVVVRSILWSPKLANKVPEVESLPVF